MTRYQHGDHIIDDKPLPSSERAKSEPPDPDVVDSLAAVIARCEDLAELIGELDARAPMSPAERICSWHHVHCIAQELAIVLGQMSHDAVDAMRQLGVEEADTDIGRVHVDKGKAPPRWHGYDLIDALAIDAIDRSTGERTRMVRVDVLRDVIAGAASPDQTSSAWLSKGLDKHRPGWRKRFRSWGEAGPDKMKPGPKPAH